MLNLRRLLVLILAILIFIAFTTKTYWIQWTFLAFITLVMIIISELFLEEEEFANSPNYNYWKNLYESRLLDFDTDQTTKNQKKMF